MPCIGCPIAMMLKNVFQGGGGGERKEGRDRELEGERPGG